ncbi:MAG: Glu-tRNA(Gln) amidotransferase subunit GatD [Nanoarchaeota archaeon]
MEMDKRIGIGDYVEVILIKKEYKGVFLEAPKNEKGIILLKLTSGYNIGINRKDILEIKLLKKSKVNEGELKLKYDQEKPNIAVIITGGTIASRYDAKTGAVKWLTSPRELFKFYPELFEKVNVTKIEVPFMKASEDMDFKDWKKIAKTAVELLNNGDIEGIIITHGTDFLHYTSSALSFFLRELNKPVVLTYSQRSIDRASSDANLNLRCSALAAISDIAEVMLVGHSSVSDDFCEAMPGAKVRKLHTSKRDAFKVINDKPIAKISPDFIEILKSHKIRNKNKVRLDSSFEEKIALIKFYPGQDPIILDYYLKNKYKGIIIEASGLGHVAVGNKGKSWIKKLKEVINKGLVVCITSQTIFGRVDPLVYSNGREILETGVIYLEDMLAETALVKLGWVLGHKDWCKNKEIIKEKMLENFAGEFNRRLEE